MNIKMVFRLALLLIIAAGCVGLLTAAASPPPHPPTAAPLILPSLKFPHPPPAPLADDPNPPTEIVKLIFV
ncbi:MAG: hypothetical protein SXV54_22555, partial [Chloroflexota bacterium]|nr:hypothetical protein [Chloroflexota bacterium]